MSVTGQAPMKESEKGCQEEVLLLQALSFPQGLNCAEGVCIPEVQAAGICSPAVGWQKDAPSQTSICQAAEPDRCAVLAGP